MVIRYARIIANGRVEEGNKERASGKRKIAQEINPPLPSGDAPAATNCIERTVVQHTVLSPVF